MAGSCCLDHVSARMPIHSSNILALNTWLRGLYGRKLLESTRFHSLAFILQNIGFLISNKE